MVVKRPRSTGNTERDIEAFAARAERPAPKALNLPSWKLRNKEPKTKGINFRASESQMELLQRAAQIEELSQQKVLERIIWPILEDKYGSPERY